MKLLGVAGQGVRCWSRFCLWALLVKVCIGVQLSLGSVYSDGGSKDASVVVVEADERRTVTPAESSVSKHKGPRGSRDTLRVRCPDKNP